VDYLWYKWVPPPVFQTWDCVQEYWAATKHTEAAGPGVYVNTWDIHIKIDPYPYQITHTRRPPPPSP
jgi:hypothetical protein